MRTRAILIACLLLTNWSGCAIVAKKEVRTLVASEEARLRDSRATLNDPIVSDYLNKLAFGVLEAAYASETSGNPKFKTDEALNIFDNFRVYAVHDLSPNAWVVGDDFVGVDTPLILLASRPEELVWILGHEFGHIHEQHMVETVMRRQANTAASVFASALLGAAAGFNRGNNPQYSQQQYQRDMDNAIRVGNAIRASFSPHRPIDEFEADEYSVKLMWGAGYSLEFCADFLERLASKYGDGESRSHPGSMERARRIRSTVAALPKHEVTKHPDQRQFALMQNRVREITVDAFLRDAICFDSVERIRYANGRPVTALKACGPLDANAQTVVETYIKLLKNE